MRRLGVLAAAIAAAISAAQPARAEGVNAQSFNPAEDAGAFITSHDSVMLKKGGVNAGLFLNFVNDPIIAVDSLTGKKTPVVDRLYTFDAFASYAFHPIFQASVAVPYNFSAGASPTGKDFNGGAMGDLRVKGKVSLLDREETRVGVAFLPYVNVPSGKAEAYVGDGSMTGGGNVAADIALPGIIDRSIVVGANAGLFGRKPASGGGGVKIGSQMSYGVAVNVPVFPIVDLVLDSYGRTLLDDPFGEIAGTPLEIDGGVHLLAWRNKGIRVTSGVGTGLTQGVGAPAFRVFSGVVYTIPGDNNPDSDGDGFPNATDACPAAPEDVDGWQDQDGCPEESAVVAGRVLDGETGAPVTAVAELDPDGVVLDARGAYRMITEGTGVDRKLIVRAPGFEPKIVPLKLVTGDSVSLDVVLTPLYGRVRGTVTARGTGLPLAANLDVAGRRAAASAEGLFDVVLPRHAAPLAVTVSARGYLDRQLAWLVAPGAVSEAAVELDPKILSVPVRVVDAATAKPLAAAVTLPTRKLPVATDSAGRLAVEVQEGAEVQATVFANGYVTQAVTFPADVTEAVVALKKKAIQVVAQKLVLDPIYFENNKAVILENSYAPLDGVADWLKDNPEIKLRIEGHTDDVGNDAKNLKLSKQRASAVVDFLVSRGVAKERFKSDGFGEKRPIAPNDTPEGKAKNRRVEFIVEEGETPR